MSKIGKILVSNGLQKKATRMNLGGTHITSMDFGRLQVLSASLLMPKDKVKMDIAHNIRLSPLVAPTIGDCKLKTKAFFVPCRVAWQGFNDFLAETPWSTVNGPVTPLCPKISNDTMSAAFAMSVGLPISGGAVGRGTAHTFGGNETISYKFRKLATSNISPSLIHITNKHWDEDNVLCELVGITDGQDSNGIMKHFVPVSGVAVGAGGTSPIFDFQNAQTNVSTNGIDFISLPCLVTSDSDGKVAWCVDPTHYPTTLNTGSDQWKNECHYNVLRLTRYGKALYNLLLSFGYRFNMGGDFITAGIPYQQSSQSTGTFDSSHAPAYGHFASVPTSSQFVTIGNCKGVKDKYRSVSWLDHTTMSAIPLLSYIRLYLDYFAPTQFYTEFETSYGWYQSKNQYQWQWADLLALADLQFSNYDKDIFTTAWRHPNAPADTQNAPFSTRTYSLEDKYGALSDIVHEDTSGGHSMTISNNTSSSGLISNISSSGISDLTIRLVRAMTKYSRINNVFGYRAVDRFLGKYGIRPSDERINRVEMVGGSRSEFDVSLVMSQSDTSTANLGDYVGHAESRNASKLGSYTASEWGYLIIVGWITPKTMYYQGRERSILYTEAKDYHDPIIDDLDAMQSIRYDELVCDAKSPYEQYSNSSYKADKTFGYTRMWHEMKHGRDSVTGDFALDSRGKYTNQCFHLFRTLPSLSELAYWYNTGGLVNDTSFNRCEDAYQYDRIFQTQDTGYDHFLCYFKITINCSRYTKSLMDYTIDDENDETRCSSSEMFGTQVV